MTYLKTKVTLSCIQECTKDMDETWSPVLQISALYSTSPQDGTLHRVNFWMTKDNIKQHKKPDHKHSPC